MIKKNSTPNFKMASEKYGLVEIKDDEALMMCSTIMDNNPELPLEEVLLDLRCIDALLHARKINVVAVAMTKRTQAGFFRKNTAFWHTMNGIIEGRLEASKQLNK